MKWCSLFKRDFLGWRLQAWDHWPPIEAWPWGRSRGQAWVRDEELDGEGWGADQRKGPTGSRERQAEGEQRWATGQDRRQVGHRRGQCGNWTRYSWLGSIAFEIIGNLIKLKKQEKLKLLRAKSHFVRKNIYLNDFPDSLVGLYYWTCIKVTKNFIREKKIQSIEFWNYALKAAANQQFCLTPQFIEVKF